MPLVFLTYTNVELTGNSVPVKYMKLINTCYSGAGLNSLNQIAAFLKQMKVEFYFWYLLGSVKSLPSASLLFIVACQIYHLPFICPRTPQ